MSNTLRALRSLLVLLAFGSTIAFAQVREATDVKLEFTTDNKYMLDGKLVPLEELKWEIRGLVVKGPVRVVIHTGEHTEFKVVGLAVRAAESAGATTAMAVSGPRKR